MLFQFKEKHLSLNVESVSPNFSKHCFSKHFTMMSCKANTGGCVLNSSIEIHSTASTSKLLGLISSLMGSVRKAKEKKSHGSHI